MSYEELLSALGAGGFDVIPDGPLLRVRPAARLTDELRAAIREHRDRLLAARCELCGRRSGGYGFCRSCDPFRVIEEETV